MSFVEFDPQFSTNIDIKHTIMSYSNDFLIRLDNTWSICFEILSEILKKKLSPYKIFLISSIFRSLSNCSNFGWNFISSSNLNRLNAVRPSKLLSGFIFEQFSNVFSSTSLIGQSRTRSFTDTLFLTNISATGMNGPPGSDLKYFKF